MLVGRDNEQSVLLSLLDRDESQFCAVYGRRRVGKTFLIRETFAGKFAFQHIGLANASRKEQLYEFRESLRQAGLTLRTTPQSWYEAFHKLEELLNRLPAGKKVIFLDELSWMDTPKSNFISALEHFWNGWATARPEKDIILIVCGSATSWIINKVIYNHGGLHNRLTMQLHLKPFTLKECKEYTQSLHIELSHKDIAEAYMIMGGVPYYWSFLHKGESLAQNIDRLFFAENAPLAHEYDILYASLFKNSGIHTTIINTLASKKIGMTRKEILSTTQLSDNTTFSQALDELEQCSFIRRYHALGKKKHDTLYQLIDNLTLFHLRFIAGNTSRDRQYWLHTTGTPTYYTWAGLAFERLCLWHIPQIKTALSIAGIGSAEYSWRTEANSEHDGAQIDLIIDRNDNIINLCEMKYSDAEYAITKEEDCRLRSRQSIFKSITHTRKTVHLTFITLYGLRHNAYWSSVQSEIQVDELFR